MCKTFFSICSRFKKNTYALNTFSYYGTHIWNILPNDLNKYTSAKEMTKKGEGPKSQYSMCDVLR